MKAFYRYVCHRAAAMTPFRRVRNLQSIDQLAASSPCQANVLALKRLASLDPQLIIIKHLLCHAVYVQAEGTHQHVPLTKHLSGKGCKWVGFLKAREDYQCSDRKSAAAVNLTTCSTKQTILREHRTWAFARTSCRAEACLGRVSTRCSFDRANDRDRPQCDLHMHGLG